MSDFRSQVERAMVDWWTKNGETPNLEPRFSPVVEQKIFDSTPAPFYAPPGAARITHFLGMPVLVDDAIPHDEIHFYQDGKLVGKIAGLEV